MLYCSSSYSSTFEVEAKVDHLLGVQGTKQGKRGEAWR